MWRWTDQRRQSISFWLGSCRQSKFSLMVIPVSNPRQFLFCHFCRHLNRIGGGHLEFAFASCHVISLVCTGMALVAVYLFTSHFLFSLTTFWAYSREFGVSWATRVRIWGLHIEVATVLFPLSYSSFSLSVFLSPPVLLASFLLFLACSACRRAVVFGLNVHVPLVLTHHLFLHANSVISESQE